MPRELIRIFGYHDYHIAMGHGGAVAGYQAALYVNREKDLGIIVLANALGRGAVDSDEIGLTALDLLSK